MKKRILFLAGFLLSTGMNAFAQQLPTSNAPAGAAANGSNNNQFWSRAGNNNFPLANTNNIFGTLWNSPIYVQTNGLNRVAFFSTQGNLASPWVAPLPFGGGVGINLNPASPIRNPLSLLHIGEENQGPNQGGYRSWMQVGTFYGYQSDQMYVGMKREASTANDRTDAIINWGDNTNVIGTPTEYGPDYLRFIFTARRAAAGENTFAAGENGLEIMRLHNNGSVGVGNFYNDPLFPFRTPSRRLEILSDKTTAGGNGTPILRMTHTQQNPAALNTTGKFIDFEPRATGDLAIQAFNNILPTTATRNFKQRYVGINTSTPGNTLEINSQFANANTLNGNGIATGWAGLRFTDLTSSSITQTNPGTGVLAVNPSGDVIYVEGSAFGTVCSADSSTYFQEHRKVNLNNHNFYFEGDTDTAYLNRVGIGWPCGTTLKAKLDVFTENRASTAGSFMTLHNWTETYGTNFTGAVGMTLGDGGGTAAFYGLRGHSFASNYTSNNGVYGFAPVDVNSYAGYFNGDVYSTSMYSGSDSTLKTQINPLNGALKIIGQLSAKTFYWNSASNPAFSFSEQKQYGFIAQEVQNVLPSLVKQSHLAGEYDAAGNFIANPKSYLALNYMEIIPINTAAIIELNQKVERATLSDETIKTNVQDLTGSLDKVLDMRGVSYDWNHTVHPELNLDSTNHVGFIAQEIAQIDPRLTYLADDSLLHVEYDKVVPILAEAIQELNGQVESKDSIINAQSAQITDLNNRLTQLENCLSGILPYLCQLSHSAIQANTPQSQEVIRTELSVRLSNREAIILDQNVPNPFAEQTAINFSIPASVQKAQIHFYDGQGKLMQSVDVMERGLGSLTVFGADLSTGVYTYTLVADGQIVATKKMVKQ